MTEIHITDPSIIEDDITIEKTLRPSHFDDFVGQNDVGFVGGCHCFDSILLAASITALTILSYPVHLQRFPANHRRIRSSEGLGSASKSAFDATINPGVHIPH